MKKLVYWLDSPTKGRIGTMPRPRGNEWLETEMQAFQREGVDVILSLLTYPEQVELGLTHEADLCQQYGIDYLSFPIKDFHVPESKANTGQFVRELAALLDEGKHLAIHCRAGIGRSSLIAASTLTTYGMSADEAFAMISERRGVNVPDTQEQREWVDGFAQVYTNLN